MLKYNLVQRSDPRDSSLPKKWYASPKARGRKTFLDISEDVASSSTLSRGDVMNVLVCLADILPKYLLDGQSVELGEIGTLRITFTSDGVENEADFHTGRIGYKKIAFKAGLRLNRILDQTGFEKE